MQKPRVKFSDLEMPSPIGVAAIAPYVHESPRVHANLILKYVDAGAGFVYTPFITSEPKRPPGVNPVGRFLKSEIPGWGPETLITISSAYHIGFRLDEGIELTKILKKELPTSVPLIGNIMGPGADPQAWAELARKVTKAGVNAIELDVSCPLPANELKVLSDKELKKNMPQLAGCLLGDTPELLEPIVGEVVKAVDVPVGLKLTPETGFPRLLAVAQLTKNAGGKFVTAINSPLTVAPPDIYNHGKPRFQGFDSIPMGSLHGPSNRFTCYKHVATIAKFVPGIDIAAVGGIVRPEHVIEAMMLGARIVEFCSGLLWKGIGVLRQANQFLEHYMKSQGYKSVEDFIGLGLKHIVPVEKVRWPRLVAEVDWEKCIGCGICSNNLCFAIQMKERKPVVDVEICNACGLCVNVCPKGAAKLRKR